MPKRPTRKTKVKVAPPQEPKETQPAPQTPSPRESWEGFALAAILLLAAAFRLWSLGKNGFGNPYYASAVRSMLMSWHNFFFVSFDPAGWVTVDKPPVSLWVQTVFAKLFGYSGMTLILPQVLEGLGSVALVHHLVRRRFDALAALLAGLAMALSPVSVAVDRYNNTDGCLVLVLLLSVWALDKAVQNSSRGYLMLSLAMAGVAFNTKMMAGFVALPAFYLLYWVGARLNRGRRLADLLCASLVLAVVALSWPLAVDMTAPEQRPFVGSTQDNSMISLSLGWNGFQRLLRGRGRGPFGAGQRPAVMNATPAADSPGDPAARNHPERTAGNPIPSPTQMASQNTPPPFNQGRGRGGGRGGMMMGNGQPGPLRLADRNMAGQTGWFLPLAIVGLFLTWRRAPAGFPLSETRQPLFFWAIWFLLYAAVFSFMRGAMHPYYLVLLAPPMAALAGIGMRTLWLEFNSGEKNLLPLTLLLTVTWHAFIAAQFQDWAGFLVPVLLAGAAILMWGFLNLPGLPGERQHRFTMPLLWSALALLFFCPVVWALSPVLGRGQSVEANPDLLTGAQNPFGRGFGGNQNTDRLVDFLRAHRHGEKYLVAGQNSQSVDSIIIKTGEPAIALGGFMGGDPIVTVNQFAGMVIEGKIRYFLLQGGGGNRAGAGLRGNPAGGRALAIGFPEGFGMRTGLQADLAKWVRDNGQPVDPKLWGGFDPRQASQPANPGAMGWGGRRGTPQLYDLRPEETAKNP